MDERAIERQRETNGQIERDITRESLERIKRRLMRLAPAPEPGGKRDSCLYRLSEDTDHRFALYVNSSFGNYGTPAHNHSTWAVIVGVTGEELNRFYDRVDGGEARG